MSTIKSFAERYKVEYQDLDEYIAERRDTICEVLEEDTGDGDEDGTLKYLGVYSDTFDTESFSVWADL